MGRYNSFEIKHECPHCRKVADLTFQADIGVLEWLTYRVGDSIDWAQQQMKKPQFGLVYYENRFRSYWAIGLARCSCGVDIWAKVIIKRNKFVGIAVAEDPGDGSPLSAWGYLTD